MPTNPGALLPTYLRARRAPAPASAVEAPPPLFSATGYEETVRLICQKADLEHQLREEREAAQKGMESLLLQVIEALDAAERIFAAAEEQRERLDPLTRRWVQSFTSVRRLLEGTLRRNGVIGIRAEDTTLDPEAYKVVGVEDASGQPEDAVLRVVTRGYCWHERILRAAEVVVAGHREAADHGKEPRSGEGA